MKSLDLSGAFGRAAVLSCLALLVLGSLYLPALTASASGPPYQADGFNVLSIAWGTSAIHSQAGPGDTDVPLTIILQYIYGSFTAISTSGTLETAGTGFSASNGGSNSTVYYMGSLMPGSIFDLTFYVNLNSTLVVGDHYSIPLTLLWSAVLTNSTSAPETSLIQSTSISVPINGDADLTFETSQTYLTSGQVNDLNFTVTNIGTGSASDIITNLSSQQAGVQSIIPEIQNLTAGSSISFPLQIYVPESAVGSVTPLSVSATYVDSYGNNASTSQVIDLHSSAASEPKLVFNVEKETLIPGESNNITVTLTNIGAGNVSDIVTTTSSSMQGISTLEDFPILPSLTPGTSYTANVTVYVSNSDAGEGITLTFSSTYLDPYGTSESTNQDVGFQIASSSNILSNTFSISTIANSVTSGSVSAVTFQVKNIGSSEVYSPVFSLSVDQPLVIAGNSTFATGADIAPGQSQNFTADLTASPGSTIGIYPATLQISFTDQYGSSHNQSYPVAITLSGSIVLVIQDEAVSQNETGLTVTGNILDEGSASAYYLSAYGYANNSTNAGPSTYVGEVDPNTPVPFTVTMPYQAGNSATTANVTIGLQFMNSLEQTLNTSSSETTRLESASQILIPDSSQSPGTDSQTGFNILELGIILTVVLVVAGVGIFAAVKKVQAKKMKPAVARSGMRTGYGSVS